MRHPILRGLAALVLPALMAGSAATGAQAAPGAPIYVGGEATGALSVWNQNGKMIDSGETNYSVADGFAVGDVDGDGADEVVIAGDVSDDVDIYKLGGSTSARWSWDSGYTINDGFAVGDVLGGPEDEILVAGEVSGDVDIFDHLGNLLATFDIDYTILDGFAVANVDGVGKDEILVAGDVSGDVDIFAGDGTQITTFTSSYNVSDQFAAGDVDGDGIDDIVVAGDVSGDVDVYSMSGAVKFHWTSSFNISDGLAVGDVDDDGLDEIVVAGDVSGQIDVYSGSGTLEKTFAGDFTIADGLAIGRNAYPDADGDGLLDQWELNGFDADDDGDVDVDLPGMGCSPDHKDLLLEFDWMPGHEPKRAAVQRMIASFALAPIDAGGTTNPDGQPGITMHVDTGTLSDPTEFEGVASAWGTCQDGIDNDNDGVADGMDADSCSEAGDSCLDGIDNDDDGWTDADDGECREGRNSCSDGADNDGDGLVDADDVGDCQVGDALGGGNQVPAADCLDTAFYTTKQANFDSARRRIFRYAISASSTGLDCGGGLGEVGGNDFLEFNHDGGTIMHEFGHNLGLRHGGNDTSNCKPNYVSGMNYDNQFNIRRSDGSRIIDYSPALRIDGTRGGNLPSITENALNENLILDATETSLLMVFTDGSDDKVTGLPSMRVDWDGNGMITAGSTVTGNIDTVDSDGNPEACSNSATNSTLGDHDDWSVISMSFRGSEQYDDGAPQPAYEREQTLAEMEQLERSLNTTDLAVTLTDGADPAIAGTTVSYALTVENLGKNGTQASSLRATIPAGLTPVALDGCHWAPGQITCDVGWLPKGASRTFAPTFAIAADLVHVAGAPVTLAVHASSLNAAGGDPIAANDARTETTLVKAQADLALGGLVTSGAPQEILIGRTATVTVQETLGSGGPSSPMDALVTRTAAAEAGSSVTLLETTELVPAVAEGSTRTASATLDVACSLPGLHGFQLGSTVAPARPDDTDPNGANDHADASFAIECVVPVSIRILPSVHDAKKGVVPVEIRSNEAGEFGLPLSFDASSIVATSVRFGTESATWANAGGASEQHGTTHGGEDRVLHFPMGDAGLPDGEPQACVKGSFTAPDGNVYKFFGCDDLRWSGR